MGECIRSSSRSRPSVTGIRVSDLTTDNFSYADVPSLYASADVFVSLHRAEGLGLGLMEAMALGKPVIATAWSGNMSFMNHTNACLVGYQLVPVQGSIDAYKANNFGRDSYWADPDLDQAARWMARLATDPNLRLRIGAKAAKDMRRYQKKAREASFVDEIRAIWESQNFKALDASSKREEIQRLRKLLAPHEPNFLRRTRSNVMKVLDRHLLWRFHKAAEDNTPIR